MFRFRPAVCFTLFVVAIPAFCQAVSQTSAVRDAQAIALAQSAVKALTGNVEVADITLTGSATETLGSRTETGQITLTGMGKLFSQVTFNSTAGTVTEIRRLSNAGSPEGVWIGLDGTSHTVPAHNSTTDAAWFFPALGMMSQVTRRFISAAYVGPEDRDGVSAQHIHLAIAYPNTSPSAPKSLAIIADLSGTDIYLNSSSLLPMAVAFNTHPDKNVLTKIPVEVDFSDYRLVEGVQVPFRIQKFLNGVLLYDISVESASINSGLTAANFSNE